MKSVVFEDPAEQQGFTQFPNAILFAADVAPTAKLAYAGLAFYARQAESCWPGQELVAGALGLSERGLRDAIRALEKAGLVRTQRRGRGHTNLYFLRRATKPAPIPRPANAAGHTDDGPAKSAALDRQNLPVEEEATEEDTDGAVVPLFASPSTSSASRPTGPIMEDIEFVFEHWKLACGKNGNCHLTDDRIRVIRKALRTYPKPELLLAVKGWKQSPFHRGENEDGKVWNELELLLRNAANIEKFRDLAAENEKRGPGREAELRRSLRETAESMGVSEAEVMRIQAGRFDALLSA